MHICYIDRWVWGGYADGIVHAIWCKVDILSQINKFKVNILFV